MFYKGDPTPVGASCARVSLWHSPLAVLRSFWPVPNPLFRRHSGHKLVVSGFVVSFTRLYGFVNGVIVIATIPPYSS